MRKNAKNNKKGFTLIELIVVVAILVALMLMLVPRLTGFTDDAKKTANSANARAIYTPIKASETAKTTGMYDTPVTTGENANAVKLCGVDVYKAFWDDEEIAAGTGTSQCSVEQDASHDNAVTKVYYGGAADGKLTGFYPQNAE